MKPVQSEKPKAVPESAPTAALKTETRPEVFKPDANSVSKPLPVQSDVKFNVVAKSATFEKPSEVVNSRQEPIANPTSKSTKPVPTGFGLLDQVQ